MLQKIIMYNFLLSTHSYMRWLVLVAAVLAIAIPFFNKTLSGKSKLPGLALMIACDLQLLLGLTLYFIYSPLGMKAFESGMGTVMKTAMMRKIAVEHFILMLVAIALVHIGYSKIKRATEASQVSKTSLVFFGIALVLMLAGIPW